MSSGWSPDGAGRDYRRAMLVVGCLCAVFLATALVTSTAVGDGLGAAPAGSLLPVELLDTGPEDGGGPGDGKPRLGALNPGDRTGVGGSIESETNPFRSQSAAVEFVVRSDSPAYWRTGAYATYTGGGWTRGGSPTDYDGPIPAEGLVGERVHYEVRLAREATGLPTVWRPRTVSTAGDASLTVTERRAIRAEAGLPAGTAYEGTSAAPPRDPAVLRTAGRDYPDAIADRYTSLPADVDPRIERFAGTLTADADSPYETAVAIETWLEANKTYSLNVSQPPDDDVASQFVFGMEAGYCEYFATSMVVMLRSQGVPARYVVGYSTGDRTGPDEYTVRRMNAHAWVEVYFPDVGWVRFDPTPGRERIRAERQAFQNQREGEYDPVEPGSPGETNTGNGTDGSDGGTNDTDGTGGTNGTAPNGSDGGRGDLPGERPDDGSGAGYRVSFADELTPGARVTVRVTRNGDPSYGVRVLFDGEAVGRTDVNGTVTGRVPYTDRLNVTLVPPEPVELGDNVTKATTPPGGGPPGSSRQFAARAPSQSGAVTNRSATNHSTTRHYSLDTTATVQVAGEVRTNGRVVVTATVGGTPVRRATVSVDGERVGQTDDDGRARLFLPAEPGNVTVAVARGPVEGSTTLDLPRLSLVVEPTFPVALPFTPVRTRATLGGEPAANATVHVGDRRVGTTGFDGGYTATLPFRDRATLVVSTRGQRRTATVSGLYGNLAGVLGGLALVVVGVIAVRRRTDATPREGLARLLRLLRDLVQALLGGLIALAGAVASAAGRLRALLAGRRPPADLRSRLRARAAGLAAGVRAWAAATMSRLTDRDEMPETDAIPAVAPDRRTIREAWTTFLGHVSVARPETETPGEIAAHAIRVDGLPAEAVTELRDAYRAVEYGRRDPDARLRTVERAVDRIETAAGERDGGSETGDPDTAGGGPDA